MIRKMRVVAPILSLVLFLQSCSSRSAVSPDSIAGKYENKVVQVKNPSTSFEDAKLFLVENGKKRWILSMDWFKTAPNRGPAQSLSREELDSIPDGTPIR